MSQPLGWLFSIAEGPYSNGGVRKSDHQATPAVDLDHAGGQVGNSHRAEVGLDLPVDDVRHLLTAEDGDGFVPRHGGPADPHQG